MDFIKIIQTLGAFLGTQSWGCLTKALDQFGYKLETLSMLSDKVGPTYQRKRKRERERRFTQFGFH